MKICSACGSTYPDSVAFCYNDGLPLSAPAPSSARRGPGGVLVGDPIDAGFTSVVYRATTPEGEAVALKLMVPHLADRAEARSAFVQCHARLRGVEHPGLVRVRAVLEDGPLPAVLMDLIDGVDLRVLARHLRQRAPAPGLLIYLGERLCRALEAMQAAAPPAAHGALGLNKVLVNRDGEILLLAGRALEDPSPGDTRAEVAPPPVDGADVDARTDVHGVAWILSTLLLGAAPAGPDALAGGPGSEALRAALASALHPDPALRPADAAALREALEALPEALPTEEAAAGWAALVGELLAAGRPSPLRDQRHRPALAQHSAILQHLSGPPPAAPTLLDATDLPEPIALAPRHPGLELPEDGAPLQPLAPLDVDASEATEVMGVSDTAETAELPREEAPRLLLGTAEADAPEVDAPEPDAPEADAPEADAPEADVPEADVPEAGAPEADVPEVNAPTDQRPRVLAEAPTLQGEDDPPLAEELPEDEAPGGGAPEDDAPAAPPAAALAHEAQDDFFDRADAPPDEPGGAAPAEPARGGPPWVFIGLAAIALIAALAFAFSGGSKTSQGSPASVTPAAQPASPAPAPRVPPPAPPEASPPTPAVEVQPAAEPAGVAEVPEASAPAPAAPAAAPQPTPTPAAAPQPTPTPVAAPQPTPTPVAAPQPTPEAAPPKEAPPKEAPPKEAPPKEAPPADPWSTTTPPATTPKPSEGNPWGEVEQ